MRVYHISAKTGNDTISPGEGDRVHLSRWILLGGKNPWVLQLLVNQIHYPDVNDCYHDHPWPFLSLVLWGGYVEEIKAADGSLKVKRRWPGMIHYRPATHTHRIVRLPWGKSYTLVLQLPKVREYGYHTREGWVHWIEYVKKQAGKGIAWCRPIRDDE